tara:strand:- start:354 stop:587 length:234 start_codon:yes stop_codon:yes gene_type:complete
MPKKGFVQVLQTLEAKRSAKRVIQIETAVTKQRGKEPTIPTLLSYAARKVAKDIRHAPLEDEALREALYAYLERFVR